MLLGFARIYCLWLVVAIAQSSFAGEPIVRTINPGIYSCESEFNPSEQFPPDVAWDVRQPLSLRYISKVATRDGWTTLVFYAEPGEQYIIDSDLIDWENRSRSKQRWILTVEGDNPTPPDPELSGISREVYERAKAINEPEIAEAFAANYRTIESQIAAGGMQSVSAARDQLLQMNSAVPDVTNSDWGEIGKKLGKYMNRLAQTLPKVQDACSRIAIGLESAAR